MDVIRWLFDSTFQVGDQTVLWREVIGNLFGLVSALGGMRRKVWAWPIGIAGNLLLFTVFLGAVFGTPNPVNLLGQAGRQVMFIVVSIYGWWAWQRTRRAGRSAGAGAGGSRPGASRDQAAGSGAVQPVWAGLRTRILLVVALLGGTAILTPIFSALGSYPPVWSDAWIFMGSLLATYGMAKGWVEFWLIWVAVDIVGVPLLLSAGYWASAIMYVFYGVFTLTGFFVWARTRRLQDLPVMPDPAPAPAVGP